jgi:hypothetical protein
MSVRHSDAADQDLLKATDDLKKEYVKHMIELVREDMKMVMIYVAALLAIVATVTTKIPIPTLAALTFPEKLLMALGVVAAMSAAFFVFLLRPAAASCADVHDARACVLGRRHCSQLLVRPEGGLAEAQASV